MSDPGERLCFQPTTLFSFFGILFVEAAVMKGQSEVSPKNLIE